MPYLCRLYDSEAQYDAQEEGIRTVQDHDRGTCGVASEFGIRIPDPRKRRGKGQVRPRRTFTSAVEARTFAKLKAIERINHGTAGVSMDEQVRGDALAAREFLRPFSATLLDAAREYARRRELVTRSCTVAEAIKACLDAKKSDNLRPKYLTAAAHPVRTRSWRPETVGYLSRRNRPMAA